MTDEPDIQVIETGVRAAADEVGTKIIPAMLHVEGVVAAKASEGQRAAALLMMLIKQDGGPLLVEQPRAISTTVSSPKSSI